MLDETRVLHTQAQPAAVIHVTIPRAERPDRGEAYDS